MHSVFFPFKRSILKKCRWDNPSLPLRFLCFCQERRMFPCRETYVFQGGNIRLPRGKHRKCRGLLTKMCLRCGFYTCTHMRARTRPREIHNVGPFPSVFWKHQKMFICNRLVHSDLQKIFKKSAKKYCVKVAGKEKVRTFATAFERESRWRWQAGKERQTLEGAAPEYLTLQDGKGARKG